MCWFMCCSSEIQKPQRYAKTLQNISPGIFYSTVYALTTVELNHVLKIVTHRDTIMSEITKWYYRRYSDFNRDWIACDTRKRIALKGTCYQILQHYAVCVTIFDDWKVRVCTVALIENYIPVLLVKLQLWGIFSRSLWSEIRVSLKAPSFDWFLKIHQNPHDFYNLDQRRARIMFV